MRTLVPAALAALVLTCACGDLNAVQALGSPTPSVAPSLPKPSGEAKPAQTADSPLSLVASRLDARLRAVAPASFAGLVVEGDRSIIVYATVVEPALSGAIGDTQASTSGAVAVRVMSGVKNSLATLESVRDQVTARQRDLAAQGVNITQWGVDVVANRVRIGVLGLTPKISADLAYEFGADLILVVEGSIFRTTN